MDLNTDTLDLSVIIPVGPGENAWPGLLSQLTTLGPNTEIILVHAVNCPLVDKQCSMTPVRHIQSAAGRARQLNMGAACAKGRWLWFLHADTRLTSNVLPILLRFIRDDNDVIGYFNLRFDQCGLAPTCLNAFGANLRSRLFGLPFGDQGFIMRADCFHHLGNFNEQVRHGEDHLLIWQARKERFALHRLPATLVSSARRYREQGWIRTTARHLWLTAGQIWLGWHGR